MNDPAFVRSSETIGHRDRVADRLARDKRAVVERRPSVRPCSSSQTMYGAPS